ncbi:hypothetical protein A5804_002710, partial [Enterococcus faecium]
PYYYSKNYCLNLYKPNLFKK